MSNHGADINKAILPSETPRSGLICQYGGLNAKPPSGLAGKVVLAATAAQRVAAQASRLRLDHTGGVVRHCPMDDGGVVVIALSYPGRPDVDLWYAATGCQYVSNGHIRVDGGLALTRWIARSVGPL